MTITVHDALVNGNTQWRSFHCPVHDDNSPSARLNSHNGVWVCMVCGAKGKIDDYKIPVETMMKQIDLVMETQNVRIYPESYLNCYARPGDYWSQRFSEETGKELGFLYDPNTKSNGYAIRNPRGGILGIVVRGEFPKYKYPQGLETSKLLFNYHNIDSSKPVVVVEGAPDVAALWDVGVQAVGTFGARLYPEQHRLLRRLGAPHIYIAYDQDQAGRTGSEGAVESLLGAGVLTYPLRWWGAKDPGEMSKEIRTKVFARCVDTTVKAG